MQAQLSTARLEFPKGPNEGHRVIYDMINDRIGWTVVSYQGAHSRPLPWVGVMTLPMAQLLAFRLSL